MDAILILSVDAFYGPTYWRNYDPTSSSATSPVSYTNIDTHQYYAFAPRANLSQSAILESVCNISKILKGTNTGIPRTIVGEWSLETSESRILIEFLELEVLIYPDNAHQTNDTAAATSQDKRTWLRKVFEAQLAAYTPNGPNQPSAGWYFWTCEVSPLRY